MNIIKQSFRPYLSVSQRVSHLDYVAKKNEHKILICTYPIYSHLFAKYLLPNLIFLMPLQFFCISGMQLLFCSFIKEKKWIKVKNRVEKNLYITLDDQFYLQLNCFLRVIVRYLMFRMTIFVMILKIVNALPSQILLPTAIFLKLCI